MTLFEPSELERAEMAAVLEGAALPENYYLIAEAFAKRWWGELRRCAGSTDQIAAHAAATAIAAAESLEVPARPTIFMAWAAVLMVEQFAGGAELRRWFEGLGLAPKPRAAIIVGDFANYLKNPGGGRAVLLEKGRHGDRN